MEYEYEEFDLRPFIELMLKQWKFIVGTAVGFAVVALIIAKLMPSSYQATALLVETTVQDDIQFDPRIVSNDDGNKDRSVAYVSIATSDEMLQQLLDSLDSPLEGIITLEDMRAIVEVQAVKNSQIIELSVTYRDSARAAEVVNLWAEQFVVDVNTFYSGQGDQQLAFFEDQLVQTYANQDDVNIRLIAFQSRNRISTIGNELIALNNSQAGYLAQETERTLLMENVVNFRTQLSEQSGSLPMADRLTLLALQTQVFNVRSVSSVQLQIASDFMLDETNRVEQIERLDALAATVELQQTQIEEALLTLAPQILSLQEEKQVLEIEQAELAQEKKTLDETIVSLARKIEEERIISQNTSSGVQFVSQAAVPEKAESSSTLVSIILAAIIGGMLSVGYVFARDWWQVEE